MAKQHEISAATKNESVSIQFSSKSRENGAEEVFEDTVRPPGPEITERHNNGSPNLPASGSVESSNGIRPVPKKHRALKACDSCKKRKRKCFKPSSVSISCVSCTSARIPCSLETEYKADNPSVKVVGGIPEHLVGQVIENSSFPLGLIPASDSPQVPSMSQKIDLIFEGVSEILRMTTEKRNEPPMDNVKLLLDAAQTMKQSRQGTGNSIPCTNSYVADTANEKLGKDDTSILITPARSFQTSPLFLLSNSMSSVPRELLDLFSVEPEAASFDDIITKDILSQAETVSLMDDFRSNYGRWVSFPIQISSSELVERVRQSSSLLLTTCCCLSLRFSLNAKKAQSSLIFSSLVQHLIKDLKGSILRYASFPGQQTGDIEYFQAIVILAIYSTSLSSVAGSASEILSSRTEKRQINFDAWYLSGLGLSTMISKSVFGKLLKSTSTSDTNLQSFLTEIGSENVDSDQTLTIFRIYNHLVLVHLVGCVLSGRMCMVDEIRLNYCTSALSLASATNFDGRMVSEIEILLITYNFIQVNSDSEDQLELNFEAAGHEISAWHHQWSYLFEQPTLQFVELCYHFCNLQVFITYLSCKVSKNGTMDNLRGVIDSADAKMLELIFNHSLKLVAFAEKVTDDSYFAYLSDQIHFFFFYGSHCLLISISLLNQKYPKSSKDWSGALKGVTEILRKYDRIIQNNPHDILCKYKEGIIQCAEKSLPSGFKLM